MLKNSKLLTITVPKETYRKIQLEAKIRKTTVSGLVRDAFDSYSDEREKLYASSLIRRYMKADILPKKLKNELDAILKKK